MKRIKLHNDAFVELRKSAAVVADLTARAQRVASAAGPDFVVRAPFFTSGRAGRANVGVAGTTYAARRAEATSRVLTRAIDAGR